jgi:OPA family glycerol-3-phosphate transporter-like MFS transporter
MTGLYGKGGTDKRAPILATSVALGNVLGIIVTSWLVTRFGIRAAFLVPGGLTALTGLFCLRVLPSLPEAPKPPKQEFPVVRFLKDRRIRGQLLPAMFHGVIKDNISLWMAVYFLDRFAIDLESSAWYVLLIPLIGLASRFLYPICYRLISQRENFISLICFAVSAVLSVLLCLHQPGPITAALCLSLLYAVISMINTSLLSIFPLRFAKENMVSSVSGLADFATYLGAGIGSAVYGIVIARFGYVPMFVSWAVLCGISGVLVLRQKPFEKENSQ